MSEPMFFLFFFFLQFLWFQNFGNFFLFEASFSNLHKRKEYLIFFPNKFLATLQKLTPKINHWPKPLFSGSGYHSEMEPPMPFLIRFLGKKSKHGPLWKSGPILPRT